MEGNACNSIVQMNVLHCIHWSVPTCLSAELLSMLTILQRLANNEEKTCNKVQTLMTHVSKCSIRKTNDQS